MRTHVFLNVPKLIICQGMQEIHQVSDILLSQHQACSLSSLKRRIKTLGGLDALVVVHDHFFQSFKATVMHVRRS